MDTLADISCAGKHAKITRVIHGRLSNVQPFNDSYNPMKDIQTVDAAFAWDSNEGETYIIHLNQALDFTKSMEHSILCPNQARCNNVIIDDIPLHLDHRELSTHSIIFPDESVNLPLEMRGCTSYLPVRYPTDQELNECKELHLTSNEGEWGGDIISSLNTEDVTFDDFDTYDLDHNTLQLNEYEVMNNHFNLSSLSHSKYAEVSSEKLANQWGIGLKEASATLKATTQHYVTTKSGQITRRIKTKPHHLQYNQLAGYLGMFSSDTFKSNVISTRMNQYSQLFANRGNYFKCYPLKTRSHVHHALDSFIHDVGVPAEMLTDNIPELKQGEWNNICRRRKIRTKTTEPHSPWQNHCELAGGIVKRKVRNKMRLTMTPVRLWDYCWEYVCLLICLTVTELATLEGTTPFEKIHKYTPDISELLGFKWYQAVWYHDEDDPDKSNIGRWLGPTPGANQGISYRILTRKGKVISRSTVYPLSETDVVNEDVIARIKEHDKMIDERIGNHSKASYNSYDDDLDVDNIYTTLFEDDECDDEDIHFQEVDNDGNQITTPHAEDFIINDNPRCESNDEYIGIKVDLPDDGNLREGTVVSRKRANNGDLIGTKDINPGLDSRIYNVKFGDGTYQEYSTNVLMENISFQCDDYGRNTSLMKEIVGHESLPDAITKENGFYTSKHGSKKRVVTTKGWRHKIKWENGTESWVSLAELKESNPLELAIYAKAHNIIDEPAYAWWAHYVTRKGKRVINAVKHRLIRKNMKFGVKVPKDIREAELLDEANGNTLWTDAIEKELRNVRVAFDLLKDGERPPVGSKWIPYHFVFDVRHTLERKARLVAGGHRNDSVPTYNRYSSVATRDSIRLGFLAAALNNLDVKVTDIGNAYLNAKNKERVHSTACALLFGEANKGKTVVIVRALYGLKSAGNAWRHHFANFIRNTLGYSPTIADPDVYRKVQTKPDGSKYYSYLIVYVDDILCIHHKPEKIMDLISSTFRLKKGYSDPTSYLGGDIRKWKYQTDEGTEDECWAMGSHTYVKEAVRVTKGLMKDHNLQYPVSRRQGRDNPFSSPAYRPELDFTEMCDEDRITVYQNVIGILRWICELGRVDILHETSLLSQYLAQPRIGHLQQALNIMRYLEHHDRSWIVLDPSSFDVDWTPRKNECSPQERATALKDIYPDARQKVPHNRPDPLGIGVDINVFVDADHAGNRVTRRSHTGILIYCNMALMMFYSKRQNTVETSTFGSEFVALRIATEMIEAYIYKLQMFGIPINGPARIFCDNESVVVSSTYPESTLKKKHCSIAFHKIRESVASGQQLIYYESSGTNLADLLTKVLPHGKRMPLVQAILS